MAGVIVGPSMLGRTKAFASMVLFTTGLPSTTMYTGRSKYVLESVARLGLMYFFFIVGVRQDPTVMRNFGRKEVTVALTALFLSLLLSSGVFLLTQTKSVSGGGSLLIFIGIYCSISPFPVISKAVEELNLLSSEIGKSAISSALINDVVAWTMTLLAFAMQLGSMKSFMGTIVSFIVFVAFLVYVSQPTMLWIIDQTPQGKNIREIYILVLLASVLVIGVVTDVTGVSATIGVLLYGLFTPSGPPLGSALVEKLDGLLNALFMPVFYSLVGFKVDPFSLSKLQPGWIGLQWVIVVGFSGKLVGTMLASLCYNMTPRDAFLLGLLMNTKGIVEVMILVTLSDAKIINTATFTVLLLSVSVTSSIISPVVGIFYDPQRLNKQGHRKRMLQNSNPESELAILAVFHHLHNVPTLMNVVNLLHPTWMAPISFFPVHLVDLTARASTLIISHATAANNYSQQLPQQRLETESIVHAFKNFAKRRAVLSGGLFIQPYTAIAPLSTMHLEIYMIAEANKSSLILVPFHDPMSTALRALNKSLLETAPCSVGIIIDRGIGAYMGCDIYHVVVLFHGGADDHEALVFAARMAEHSRISLTVVRLIESDRRDVYYEDEQLLNEFRRRHKESTRVAFKERELENVEQMVAAVRDVGGNGCDLFVVGRGGWEGSTLVGGLAEWSEWPELGVMGDMLASSDYTASVLVMQQYVDSDARQKSL